ncbi:MAG: Hsp20/alpha crystallin family protein [Betaproteobacteria bacterium]|jgi:HSP20 family protein|nr:Hsp20/alpha crystallin family protein [Betaproteobacteria bacterium]MDH4292663.1 Hsp20/alpha crystallin family protein [Betaproteobacteria bacterium]
MVNVTRFTPFDDSFDELLRGFFVRPMAFEGAQQTAQAIRIDVAEDDKAYTVHAEIPGVKKEDIHVTIDADQVAISAETRKEREVKEGERVLRSERHYGKVYRAFTLGQAVDDEKAVAKYADGVLELTLPKKAVASVKRLSVN